MPTFLIDAWSTMSKLWGKIVELWNHLVAYIEAWDSSAIVAAINEMPVPVESLIRLLRITSCAAVAMGIICLIRAIRLNNGLPIAKAKQFLAKRKQPVVIANDPVVTILDLNNFEEPGNDKKPLISYTLTDEAQLLLDKLNVEMRIENGWNIAPGKRPVA